MGYETCKATKLDLTCIKFLNHPGRCRFMRVYNVKIENAYRCTCEHGYVRCSRPVAKRGSKCETCVNYTMGDGSHKGGYHAEKAGK